MKTEHPKYQGVVELAFLAMTPAQLLLFQSKEECTNFVEGTTQCKNVQVQSVKLLGEMEDEATTPTSSRHGFNLGLEIFAIIKNVRTITFITYNPAMIYK